MTSLPDALRPWREWLSWFDPDLATQLGPLLQRLHPLLGPFRGSRQGGEPEIEGLDDLRSRGSYEHLLASEWLIADDMPDEFLRRAASGEHMFLAPRPRARRADRSIIALFDTGPLQFGAPKLAQIAIWILLARRAQQAQGEFRWGSLQAPGELFEARTTGNLKALLYKRTFALANADSLASWRATLDQQAIGGERWVIGPTFAQSGSPVAPSFTHRVHLQRDLQVTALEVSLVERSTERSVRLPLPEPTSVAPLLRGSFKREASRTQSTRDARAVALMRPPVISFDGIRVGVALRDYPAALIFMIPRSTAEAPGAPRLQQWSTGYDTLSMSILGKQIGVLLADEEELRFWGTPLSLKPRPPLEEFRAPGSTASWLPLVWLRSSKAQRVCVIDQSGRLLHWDAPVDAKKEPKREAEPAQSLQLLANQALAMVQINKTLLGYAYHDRGRVWFGKFAAVGDQPPPRELCMAPPDTIAFFGRGNSYAVRLKKNPSETWGIGIWHDDRLSMEAVLPPDSTAIGVMREPNGRTSLITLDRNVIRLHFVDGGNELLYAAPERIVSCTVCQNTSMIAVLTERRQLVVVSAVTRELRLNVQTARQSDGHA